MRPIRAMFAAVQAALVVFVAGGPAMALDQAEETELVQRIAAGARPQVMRLNDTEVDYYRRPQGGGTGHEFLVVIKGGKQRLAVAAASFTMRNMHVGARGPNLIYVGSSGDAQCCFTAHLIWTDGPVTHQAIELGPSELGIDSAGGLPRLRFKDFGFIGWHAPPDKSPAPGVVLSYDPALGEYALDAEAMRRPAPDAQQLADRAAAIRKAYEGLALEELDPALWAAMLDLIYSGNAAAARALFAAAWPPARGGADAFLAEFNGQLWRGKTWERFDLGRKLGAAGEFPAPDGVR